MAVLVLIGVLGRALHPLASHVSAIRPVTEVAFMPMTALSPRGIVPARVPAAGHGLTALRPAVRPGARSASFPATRQAVAGQLAGSEVDFHRVVNSRMMVSPPTDAELFESLPQAHVASATAGTTKKSNEISTNDSSDDQVRAWNFVAFAKEALNRKNFVAALGFSVAAAAVLGHVDVANALPPEAMDAISMQLSSAAAVAPAASVDWGAILGKAGKKALGGGQAGASAAVVQVFSLMWLRTAMNYQYRYGGNLNQALKTLIDEGGIARLYQGLPFALLQGPLSRFGNVAAQVGVLALLDSIPATAGLPLALKTAAASLTSGLWRVLIMPIDTSKTAFQVEGKDGFDRLTQKVMKQGPGPLYQGSVATAGSSAAKDFAWFYTYNALTAQLPPASKDDLLAGLIQAALVGLSASAVSDTLTNPLAVVKTTQQTANLGVRTKVVDSPPNVGDETAEKVGRNEATGDENSKDEKGVSIAGALKLVVEKDGLPGLFGRGLKTKLLTNAIQGALFSVLWKYFQLQGPPL